MFQVKYFMDIRRYRDWTCPPAHKARGFWFWMVVLVISAPLAVYFRMNESDLRLQSLAAMGVLIAVYRGLLFRKMYANKQFRVMCIDYKKEERHGWDSRVEVTEEGICTYMDDAPLGKAAWENVCGYTVTSRYIDLNVEKDFIRLPRDAFTVGTAEEFLAWLGQRHPELERQQEVRAFDN